MEQNLKFGFTNCIWYVTLNIAGSTIPVGGKKMRALVCFYSFKIRDGYYFRKHEVGQANWTGVEVIYKYKLCRKAKILFILDRPKIFKKYDYAGLSTDHFRTRLIGLAYILFSEISIISIHLFLKSTQNRQKD